MDTYRLEEQICDPIGGMCRQFYSGESIDIGKATLELPSVVARQIIERIKRTAVRAANSKPLCYVRTA